MLRRIGVLLVVLAIGQVAHADRNLEPCGNRPPHACRPAPLTALPGLAPLFQAAFDLGEAEFLDRHWSRAEGRGPLHNGTSCSSCHVSSNGLGGYPPSAVTVYGVHGTGSLGESLFLPPGGFVLHKNDPSDPNDDETLPPWANATADRVVPQLMGLGLVEAVPDYVFRELAEANGGRVVVSPETGRVQRWGSQNQVATLKEFVEIAFQVELGLTPEESGDAPELVWGYLLLLDHPAPWYTPERRREFLWGGHIFDELECDSCHAPTLTTGSGPLEVNGVTLDIAALKNRAFHPFSDFLLHDLGPAQDSDVHLGQAGRTEYRTAPLWGMRFDENNHFHDGAEPKFPLEGAIERHGGEAAASRDAWRALSSVEKKALRRFVNSL